MTAADFIIIGIILLSGVFAMTRGLTRELFSIASWALAAAATYFLYKPLMGLGTSIFSFLPELVAQIATGVVIFTLVLLLFSFVTMKLTEKLRGKEPGKVDGTAGFLFGLVRGYVLVCLLFLMLSWFWLPSDEPKWIAGSAFRPMIDKTNDKFFGLMAKAGEKLPEGVKPSSNKKSGRNEKDEVGRLIRENDR